MEVSHETTSLISSSTSLWDKIFQNTTVLQKFHFLMPMCLLILSISLLFSLCFRSKLWISVWTLYFATSLSTFLVTIIFFVKNQGIDFSDQVLKITTWILIIELIVSLLYLILNPDYSEGDKWEYLLGTVGWSLLIGIIFFIIFAAFADENLSSDKNFLNKNPFKQFLYTILCFSILFKLVGAIFPMMDLFSTETKKQNSETNSYRPVNPTVADV